MEQVPGSRAVCKAVGKGTEEKARVEGFSITTVCSPPDLELHPRFLNIYIFVLSVGMCKTHW